MSTKIINLIKKYKFRTAILVLILAGGAYYYYVATDKTSAATTYALGTVERGSILTTVSASGQISSSNQIDVKPEVSAKIVDIKVRAGQEVKAGDILAELDTKDLAKQVRDAKSSLDIAKINLNTKQAGATADEIRLAKNSVDAAKISYDNSLKSLEDAKQAAEDNLQKARITLDNSQISLDNAQRAYDNALSTGGISATEQSQSLTNAYEKAKTDLATALITLQSGLTAADGILGIDHPPVNSSLDDVLGVLNSSTLSEAKTDYAQSKAKMQAYQDSYDQVSQNWTNSGIEGLLDNALSALEAMQSLEHYTYLALVNSISSASVSQSTLDGYRQSLSSQETTMINKIDSIKSTIQSISSAKLNVTSNDLSTSNSQQSAKSSLESAKNNHITAQKNYEQAKTDNANSIKSAENEIKNKKIALDNAQTQYNQKIAPPTALDLATLRIQITQAQNNYSDALESLGSAKIKSPIDGIVAQVNQEKGDDASPSTVIMSVITKSQIAELSLNEVDAAKVKAGQKASLTFSAIDGLEITGEVIQIDELGTVSQGVVNYTAKISLDTQDGRIKPQMSVSALVTTETKLDTLMVPNSAIKQGDNGTSYVEVLKDSEAVSGSSNFTSKTAPEQKYVEVGISSDTNTEILSGLSEGDRIVVRTVAASSNQTTTQSQSGSGIRMFGVGGAPGR